MATTLICRLLAMVLLFGAASPTLAQSAPYPNRPIQLVVGFTPGGVVDISARLLASKIREGARRPGGVMKVSILFLLPRSTSVRSLVA